MNSRLGPIDITCDAPPYSVVQACAWLEFRNPQDVRWYRMSHFLTTHGEQTATGGLYPWKWFGNTTQAREKACTCGELLPTLEWYTFAFTSGMVAHYHLGQCPRCRTIFWEEG